MPRKSKKNIEGLEMVVTIVSKGKGDYFKKIYNKVESSCQASLFGMGTADSAMLGLFGLADIEKDVILALIKKSYIEQLFTILDSIAVVIALIILGFILIGKYRISYFQK
jgi:hypothetical protein